jgi:beta-alanine degradation protein BauB
MEIGASQIKSSLTVHVSFLDSMKIIIRNKFSVALLFIFLAVSSPAVRAQDVVKVAPAHNKVLLENAEVRVIENKLAPGEKDAMHTHAPGWYYVKQPGTMKVVHADGKMDTWEAKAGEGGWLQTLDPHTAENIGKTTLVYVLVEVKSAAKAAPQTTLKKASTAKPVKSGRQINPFSRPSAPVGSGGPA